jgi:hypothetical protein
MEIGYWKQTRGYNLKVGDVLSIDYFIDGYPDMVVCTVDEMDNFRLIVAYIHPRTNEVMWHSIERNYIYWKLKED